MGRGTCHGVGGFGIGPCSTASQKELPAHTRLPKALAHDWRAVRVAVSIHGVTSVDELRSWNMEGPILGIAARPSGYEDVAGLGQWLPEAIQRVDIDASTTMLRDVNSATRQRTAYILGAAGGDGARTAIVASYPPMETVWLGPRVTGASVFDTETNVNDTLLPHVSAPEPAHDQRLKGGHDAALLDVAQDHAVRLRCKRWTANAYKGFPLQSTFLAMMVGAATRLSRHRSASLSSEPGLNSPATRSAWKPSYYRRSRCQFIRRYDFSLPLTPAIRAEEAVAEKLGTLPQGVAGARSPRRAATSRSQCK